MISMRFGKRLNGTDVRWVTLADMIDRDAWLWENTHVHEWGSLERRQWGLCEDHAEYRESTNSSAGLHWLCLERPGFWVQEVDSPGLGYPDGCGMPIGKGRLRKVSQSHVKALLFPGSAGGVEGRERWARQGIPLQGHSQIVFFAGAAVLVRRKEQQLQERSDLLSLC